MSTRQEVQEKLTELITQEADLKAKRKELQAELDKFPAFPPEPDNEPAVVYFTKTFGRGATKKQYTYHAFRSDLNGTGAPHKWIIQYDGPGRRPGPKTWEDLCIFVGEGGDAKRIAIFGEVQFIEW
jgi:hypothetical protein